MSVPALAERRHTNVDAAQPIEQIGPEQSLLHQRRKTAIGRRDDPDVDAVAGIPADALDRQILDRAKQLGLRGRREVRDFVEKERAALGRFELAAPAAHAGGRALLDAEQLRLEQRLDQRGAVDRDEGSVSAPAQLVNLTRDQLLARRRSRLRAAR